MLPSPSVLLRSPSVSLYLTLPSQFNPTLLVLLQFHCISIPCSLYPLCLFLHTLFVCPLSVCLFQLWFFLSYYHKETQKVCKYINPEITPSEEFCFCMKNLQNGLDLFLKTEMIKILQFMASLIIKCLVDPLCPCPHALPSCRDTLL